MLSASRPLSSTSSSGAASTLHQPRLSAQQWHSSLAASPQLRHDLSNAGVDVKALQAYAERAHSRAAPLHLLNEFLDPKPRGLHVPRPAHSNEESHSQPPPAVARGWDPGAGRIDWSLLNGSRELSLSVGETAAAFPDTESGRQAAAKLMHGSHGGPYAEVRRTDRRTGHRLDFALPQPGERFTKDAYYARIEDQRKSEQGKAPHMRLPAPVLYNGECREQQPHDDQERRVVEAHQRAQKARTESQFTNKQAQWLY